MEKLVKKVAKRMPKQRVAKVKIKVKDEKYKPEFKGDQKYSNCMDLKAYLPDDERGNPQRIELNPGEVMAVHTGVFLELPVGFEAVVRPRSGLALKEGITVVNSPGTIDTGYRGEIIVILSNTKIQVPNWSGYMEKNTKPYVIQDGDRIAQLAIREVPKVEVEYVEELTETDRGDKGFGSTGR